MYVLPPDANTGEYIPLVDGSTLPIRFRIEEGALPEVGGPIIAAGLVHSCGLVGGAAWCWGTNGNERLGTGTGDLLSPGPVTGGHGFTGVVAGGGHSCGLASDGSAWCWGYNGFGALGIGAPSGDQSTPQPVAGGHGGVSDPRPVPASTRRDRPRSFGADSSSPGMATACGSPWPTTSHYGVHRPIMAVRGVRARSAAIVHSVLHALLWWALDPEPLSTVAKEVLWRMEQLGDFGGVECVW